MNMTRNSTKSSNESFIVLNKKRNCSKLGLLGSWNNYQFDHSICCLSLNHKLCNCVRFLRAENIEFSIKISPAIQFSINCYRQTKSQTFSSFCNAIN